MSTSGGMSEKKITCYNIHAARCENSELQGFGSPLWVRMSWKTSSVVSDPREVTLSVAGPTKPAHQTTSRAAGAWRLNSDRGKAAETGSGAEEP